jgi:hypothetical protein
METQIASCRRSWDRKRRARHRNRDPHLCRNAVYLGGQRQIAAIR